MKGVLTSISRVKEQILLISPEQHKKGLKGQIELNERQIMIMEYISTRGKITSAEIQNMFSISRQAVYKEIKNLLDMDLIEKKGESKATYYIFK
ncbi:MAG: HTH domain-containing protein [Methanobacteriaceae archaeon]